MNVMFFYITFILPVIQVQLQYVEPLQIQHWLLFQLYDQPDTRLKTKLACKLSNEIKAIMIIPVENDFAELMDQFHP